MQAADRQRLKDLIDARTRELIGTQNGSHRHTRCVGCNGDLASYTTGCPQCRDRKNRRAYRSGDPLLLPGTTRHGTETGYTVGCRCHSCRRAATDARRKRAKRAQERASA